MRIRPDVVFTKGGFVCLPVGLAAKILGIPLVIHDSDAHPGLTNRILARYATVIGTGAPIENYPYPSGRTHYVGIPVSSQYHPLTADQQQRCKAELGLHDTKKPLLVVTGGGLGARNLNRAVVAIAPQLLEKIAIVHITGYANYDSVVESAPEHIDYIIKPFLPGQAVAFGAADVVLTRAGATTLIELAAMAKPIIIVPSPYLTGGHQEKNAAVYQKAGAAVVLQEEDIILDQRVLLKSLIDIFTHTTQRRSMAKKMYDFARPDAALDMAALIVEIACAKKTT